MQNPIGRRPVIAHIMREHDRKKVFEILVFCNCNLIELVHAMNESSAHAATRILWYLLYPTKWPTPPPPPPRAVLRKVRTPWQRASFLLTSKRNPWQFANGRLFFHLSSKAELYASRCFRRPFRSHKSPPMTNCLLISALGLFIPQLFFALTAKEIFALSCL